jgi:hypothetical protein
MLSRASVRVRALRAVGAVIGVAGLAIVGSVVPTSAASASAAAINDGFTIRTWDGCGLARYVDYGPGAPGGGNNDDYVVIDDTCGDGLGVRVRAWLYKPWYADDPGFLGSAYNRNGAAGATVVWDPFKAFGNVDADDRVELEVCLVSGSTVPDPSTCHGLGITSEDG